MIIGNTILTSVCSESVKFQLHQRRLRDAIRQGLHEPRECSVSFDDEDFFQTRKQAELLAVMPLVPS